MSVTDLFHALRALAQPIGSAIGRQVSQFNKKALTLKTEDLAVQQWVLTVLLPWARMATASGQNSSS